jgi:hypothetical protein
MFRQMDLKGQAQADTKLKSTHQNTVHTIRAHEEANGVVSSFSSKIYLLKTYDLRETNILLQRAVSTVVLLSGMSDLYKEYK